MVGGTVIGSNVILREAVKGDLPVIVALCKRTWTAIGLPHNITAARLGKQMTHQRLVVLYEGDTLLAILGGNPCDFEGQPAYFAGLVAVDQTREDKLDLLDAIILYGLNIALSEGRTVIVNRRDKRMTTLPYGVNLLGMKTSVETPDDYHQHGDARQMACLILQRHPKWPLSH